MRRWAATFALTALMLGGAMLSNILLAASSTTLSEPPRRDTFETIPPLNPHPGLRARPRAVGRDELRLYPWPRLVESEGNRRVCGALGMGAAVKPPPTLRALARRLESVLGESPATAPPAPRCRRDGFPH